jgi:hypothetical protein
MNTQLVGELVRLRYKLLWAKTRSRNGKIALFVTGYLLLAGALAFVGVGGFRAGKAAVQTGQAEIVAQIVLGVIFLEATLSTVVLGFGIGAVFAETELRRYPLTGSERRLARHVTGLVDPFWLIVMALDIGLVIGLYILGAANLLAGLVAIAVLIAANYLLARLVTVIVDKLMVLRGGAAILMGIILGLSVVPGLLASALKKNPALGYKILKVLRWTPPFGAAAAMTGGASAFLRGMALVLWWILGLALVVTWLDRKPPQRSQGAVQGPLRWSGFWERVGALFGPEYAPLVAHWLRFYTRNARFRAMYMATIPLAAFLTYQMGVVRPHSNGFFTAALGAAPLCGFLATSRFAVNLFGYTGGGFRRYFLLPTRPADSLRAASYATLLLASTEVLLAIVVWVAVSPVAWDWRMFAMLVSMGVAGLFGLHGAGLWATLYNPRRGKYDSAIGNDLSASGNALLIGSVLVPVFGAQYVPRHWPAVVSLENWWWPPVLAVLAIVFYFVSLRNAAAEFTGRREYLMALVEGKA